MGVEFAAEIKHYPEKICEFDSSIYLFEYLLCSNTTKQDESKEGKLLSPLILIRMT